MIDNQTKKAVRVNLRPLRLDTILRANLRDRSLLIGWLLLNLVEAAQKLWPNYDPAIGSRKPWVNNPFPEIERVDEVEDPNVPFLPVWRRIRESKKSRWGQGLAEYALIIGLIAVVAIVALMFMGGQIAAILSNIGESV